MSEIKPIDWDALPKVFGWNNGYTGNAIECIFLGKTRHNEFECFAKTIHQTVIRRFENISETDPRIKTPKMRVMTAEELNDIYWEFGKDFRIKYTSGAKGFGVICDVGTNLHSMEYSTDRGCTWNKCEVAE